MVDGFSSYLKEELTVQRLSDLSRVAQPTEGRVKLEFKLPALSFLSYIKYIGNTSLRKDEGQWPISGTSGSRTGPATD